MDLARALDVLSTLLVGQSLGSICVGDWWSLHLLSDPHLVLLAQEVTCPDGPQIAGSLSRIARSPMDGVDSSDIPAAVAILRNRRRAIIAGSLLPLVVLFCAPLKPGVGRRISVLVVELPAHVSPEIRKIQYSGRRRWCMKARTLTSCTICK